MKRTLRMSPEFIEDILAYSKDPEWSQKVAAGVYRITVSVDHEDGYELTLPIKISRDVESDMFSVTWETTPEEDAFERLVFRQLREK